jgi:hypothetical protein
MKVMSLFQITLPKNFTKQSINLIVNSNKLENTINIVRNKLIVKSSDIDTCIKILKRNYIPFSYNSLNK